MQPGELRSLDAVHLAIAERLGSDLDEIVVYDERMAEAARAMGYRVSAQHPRSHPTERGLHSPGAPVRTSEVTRPAGRRRLTAAVS